MSGSIKKIQHCVEKAWVSPQQALTLQPVMDAFNLSISAEMADIMSNPQQSSGVTAQFLPSVQELNIAADELTDPIGDVSHSPVAGVVHRHRDRCLLMPVKVCAVYCRFCFRREKIGPGNAAMTPDQLDKAYDYIADHPEIWEVILTGGDPLMLKPKSLQAIIQRLHGIPHVKIIRLHTRIPVVDSQRINDDMLAVLSSVKPIYMVLHVNHVNEFHDKARLACQRLVDAGVVMLSQSVLLKDINDNIDSLEQLMRLLVELRIKPYYIHQLDKARGTGHFRVAPECGVQLMQQLRQRISGLCQPTYVVDTPGGDGGKTPLC